ncbi:MAG: hypothetical protein AWM53_01198 [Candidatus Dichloromethanomonas elyunquensis]|nr:MAG: hypothetical protein AWM53_01198 [Candidatus Dichloromethanomonas elyunquensis]
MLKSKIFGSTNLTLLEKEINLWLEATSWIKVKKITQSSSEDSTIISIWYEDPDVPILQK